MRVLAITYQRDAPIGVFAEPVVDADAVLEEWVPSESPEPPAPAANYDAVISLGGAMNADQEDAHPWIGEQKRLLAELVEGGSPVLGVCLGAQLLAEAIGGRAKRASAPEIGWPTVDVTPEGAADPIIGPLAPSFEAFEWHSYECELPESAIVLARSPVCVQAYRYGPAAWGIQFHAEVSQRIVSSWFDDYQTDPDAIAIGLDPELAKAESEERIGRWNGIGRGVCARFLEVAAAAPSRR